MIANSYLHNILLCVSWKLERETEEKQRRGNTPCSIMTFRSKLLDMLASFFTEYASFIQFMIACILYSKKVGLFCSGYSLSLIFWYKQLTQERVVIGLNTLLMALVKWLKLFFFFENVLSMETWLPCIIVYKENLFLLQILYTKISFIVNFICSPVLQC